MNDGPGLEHRRPRRRAEGGFSAAELAVVLSLVAVASAIAVPGAGERIAAARIDAAARNVGLDLQKARFRAIAEGARVRVQFDTTARRYDVCREATPGAGDFTAGCVSRAVDDAGTIAITLVGDASPIFNERGRCETPATVRLEGRRQTARLVGVVASGYVHVE
jgi:type II secretory pathway pseudopilin PulG